MSGNNYHLPLNGRIVNVPVPTRVLHRFTKPGGHIAEIRECVVTTFKAIEWIVYVDGSLIESQLFHGARLDRYQMELDGRIAHFVEGGWLQDNAGGATRAQ